MAIIWKKVENDTPIRYNPEYGGEVSVTGGRFTSLVAYNTDPSSDSRVYNYIEKRIDYYHAKDDDKLTGKVYKVEIEPTNNYIEGKKLEYTRIHCGRNNSGYCTVWGYPVKWESDNDANIRWWWYNEDTHEKEEEIDVYVTLYEDVLDACVDYFEIPSGGELEETEDHKFATEWSTAVVGGKVTKYSDTYAEDKKMTVTAKGTLVEDNDLSYITYQEEAAEPTEGRQNFIDFCNIAVSSQIANVFGGGSGNKFSPYLMTAFEKFSDNVYTATANSQVSGYGTPYNIIAVYNPNYDMFSYYLGKTSDSSSAASDLESNWINSLAAYDINPLAGDTSESMVYSFSSIGINKSFILPSKATMEALAAEGKGVKLGYLDPDLITECQPARNKVGSPTKVDAPATAGGDAGDPEAYVFAIIDDYYAYLSDAEISEDPETINHKYAVEWDSDTSTATPYDETNYAENKTGTVSEKGDFPDVEGLKYITINDTIYVYNIIDDYNAFIAVCSKLPESGGSGEGLATFIANLSSDASGAMDGSVLNTSAFMIFGTPSYFPVLTDDGTANKPYTDSDWIKCTDNAYAMKIRYNRNFAGYNWIYMIYNPKYDVWTRWAQDTTRPTYYGMVTYDECNGQKAAMEALGYQLIEECDGSRVWWSSTMQRVIVLPDATTTAAITAATGYEFTWTSGWSDTELDACVNCPDVTWDSMIETWHQSRDEDFKGMLDKFATAPTPV